MPTLKRKILVIENQEFHFDSIIGNLKDYCVYPEKSNYINFIDHIRVWVNEEYSEKYRYSAIEYILKILNNKENEIELILMDHILGGAHHCLTGIDLAKEINLTRLKEGKSVLPIAFLSKTEHNYEKLVTSYEDYKKRFNFSEWIHKGYFGDELLKEEYFKSYVIPIIDKLLGDTEEERFYSAFDLVLNLNYAPNQEPIKTKLTSIRNEEIYQNMTEKFKIMIREVSSSKIVNDIKLE